MSTASRKARKRAGVKFERQPKTGTPVEERAWFHALIPDRKRGLRPRSVAQRIKVLRKWGVDTSSQTSRSTDVAGEGQ